jgi:hypothetical protein
MQAHGNERDPDGAGLTDTSLARQFGHIEYFDCKNVAATDHIIVRWRACISRQFQDPLICLLLGLQVGLDRSLRRLRRLGIGRRALRQRQGQTTHQTPQRKPEFPGRSFR